MSTADDIMRDLGARRFGEQLRGSVPDHLKADQCGQPIPAAAHNGVEGELVSEGERPSFAAHLSGLLRGEPDKAVIPQSTKANLPAEVARLRVDFAMKLQDACRLLARRENITAVIPGDGSPPYCRWTTDHDDTFQVSEIGITIWRSPQGQMRPYDPIHFDWA